MTCTIAQYKENDRMQSIVSYIKWITHRGLLGGRNYNVLRFLWYILLSRSYAGFVIGSGLKVLEEFLRITCTIVQRKLHNAWHLRMHNTISKFRS